MRKLVTYGEENFEYREIEKQGLGKSAVISVENGVEPEVKIRIENGSADEKTLRVLLGKDEKIRVRTKIAKAVACTGAGGHAGGAERLYDRWDHSGQ